MQFSLVCIWNFAVLFSSSLFYVQALKLSKASLQSKTVLTDVFLNGVPKEGKIKTECRDGGIEYGSSG